MAELNNVILMCPPVNAIDARDLESLEAIACRPDSAGICNFSREGGLVMYALTRSDFMAHFKGRAASRRRSG
jgi:sulfate permease, SulP family